MTASLQGHIHLLDASPSTSTTEGEWSVIADGARPTFVMEPTIMAAPRETVGGKRHSHVLYKGSKPVRFDDASFWVSLTGDSAPSQYFVDWIILSGQTKWFIPLLHDPNDHATYAYQVVVEIQRPDVLGYKYDLIRIPVRVKSLDGEQI